MIHPERLRANDDGGIVIRCLLTGALLCGAVLSYSAFKYMTDGPKNDDVPNPNPIDLSQSSYTYFYGEADGDRIDLGLRFSASGAHLIETDAARIALHGGQLSYPLKLNIGNHQVATLPDTTVATVLPPELGKQLASVEPTLGAVTCQPNDHLQAAFIRFIAAGTPQQIENAALPVTCRPGMASPTSIELYGHDYAVRP